jgi:hypothetical protein
MQQLSCIRLAADTGNVEAVTDTVFNMMHCMAALQRVAAFMQQTHIPHSTSVK